MHDANIGAVIIDYNSCERTVQYINDLLYSSDIKISCIAIIDNSPIIDNTFCLVDAFNMKKSNEELGGLKRNYSVNQFYESEYLSTKIYVVHSDDNLGFARGNNLGFEILKMLVGIDYVIFSNNDIQFFEFKISISKLIEDIKKNNDIGLVGPEVVGLDGKEQSPCKYLSLFERIWKNYYFSILPFCSQMYESDIIPNAKSGYVYRIIGAFMIIEADVFSKVGMFDDKTFLYAEEMILSEKLGQIGLKVYYDSSVSLIHEGGYTTKKKSKSNFKNKVQMRRTIIESNLYYYSKYMRYSSIIIWISRMMCNVHCSLMLLKLRITNMIGEKE